MKIRQKKHRRKSTIENKDEVEYTCPWCGYHFTKLIGKFEGQGTGNHSSVSTQVQCDVCQNFMKTYRKD